MLRIREAQWEVFELDRRRRFEARAVSYLREAGASAEDEPALRAVVGAAWEKSERYGLPNEHDVLRLVGLCHIFGVDFDADPRRPWVREVLGSERLDAASKVRVLWERMREESRRESGA